MTTPLPHNRLCAMDGAAQSCLRSSPLLESGISVLPYDSPRGSRGMDREKDLKAGYVDVRIQKTR